MEVKDLKFDKRNYRRHSEKNQSLIKKSINEVGFGRSIVVDAEDEIICGNGVVSQVDKKTPVKVIETDGSELIVVKRTDLKTEDAKRKQLAVMDNSTSDSSDFDLDLLQEDFDADLLGDWGIDIKEEIKKASEKPDVEFATELLEEHNYIVLYFDNKMDWNQCRELLGDLLTKFEECHASRYRIALNEKSEVIYCCQKPYEVIGHITEKNIMDKKNKFVTDMSKCDVPCVMTGANKFIKSLEDYPNDRYFI